MTAPQLHSFPPGVGAVRRKGLWRFAAIMAVFMLGFASVAWGGVRAVYATWQHDGWQLKTVWEDAWQFHALLAGPCLAGTALSLGMVYATLLGRHAIVADAISIATARRSQTIARHCYRLGWITTALTAVAGLACAFFQPDSMLAVVGIECAFFLLCLTVLSSGLEPFWAKHLENEPPS